MKNFTFIFLFSGILISGFFSCKKDAASVPDFGYNYFPDQVGRYVVYTVDSFFYDDFSNHTDTFKFQIKEKIESIYNDNQGRPTMRLERYIKCYNANIPYNLMSWTIRDVWAQNKSLTNAEKVEENVRFVKLVFPLKENQPWNGNAQNSNDAETYQYKFIDQVRTIGGTGFDSVLQVAQHDETNLILRIYAEEKYARNVGLIFKRVIDVRSQPPASWVPPMPFLSDSLDLFFGTPILKRARSGFQYTMTITSYGTE